MVSRSQKVAIIFFSFIVFATLLSLNFINRVKSGYELNSDYGVPAAGINVSESIITRNEYSFDLESDSDLSNAHTIFSNPLNAQSGSRYCLYNDSIEYGVTFNRKLRFITDDTVLDSVVVNLFLFSRVELNDVALVLSIESEKNPNLFWDRKEITGTYFEWTQLSFTFNIPNVGFSANDDVKLFVWNKAHLEFKLDDLYLKFY